MGNAVYHYYSGLGSDTLLTNYYSKSTSFGGICQSLLSERALQRSWEYVNSCLGANCERLGSIQTTANEEKY